MAIGTIQGNDWHNACTAAQTADNGGSDIVDPDLITRAAQNEIILDKHLKLAILRLRYDDGAAPDVDPVVQLFGEISGQEWQKVGSDITLVTDTADVQDGTYAYSATVVRSVSSYTKILATIKTAFTVSSGSSTSAVQILVR